eukprot:3944163-Amphidinium_carterae.1
MQGHIALKARARTEHCIQKGGATSEDPIQVVDILLILENNIMQENVLGNNGGEVIQVDVTGAV